MASRAVLGAIRFGYGPAGNPSAGDPEALLASVHAPDRMARRHPVTDLKGAIALGKQYRAAGRGNDELARREIRRALLQAFGDGAMAALARIADSDTPFFERLTWFWADHFTATPRNPAMRALAPDYIDRAIRPHVAGRFSDMLFAAVTHPFMLVYLDQVASIGPNSPVGQRRGLGLNENLAREVLELHTLGVGGPYGQDDVRQLAELLTGLSATLEDGFIFRSRIAEPGAETVLGKSYGGGRATLSDIRAVLEDLAQHPATAAHVSRKLAVHFVSDTPDPALVSAMVSAWRETDGDLRAVAAAMLGHPAAWAPERTKARQPFDFIAAAIRAFGAPGGMLTDLPARERMAFVGRPLRTMGQPFMEAPGPDGWPEAAEHWITPQGLATRISWAVGVGRQIADRAPDPREFLTRALGDAAGPRLRFAVSAAETRAEGLALVLASAEFNRR